MVNDHAGGLHTAWRRLQITPLAVLETVVHTRPLGNRATPSPGARRNKDCFVIITVISSGESGSLEFRLHRAAPLVSSSTALGSVTKMGSSRFLGVENRAHVIQPRLGGGCGKRRGAVGSAGRTGKVSREASQWNCMFCKRSPMASRPSPS